MAAVIRIVMKSTELPLRLIFMGTPEFAVPTLRFLLESSQQIAAVYSQPPRPAGRGHKLQPSPVQILAEQHGIPVYTPTSLKSPEVQEQFRTHKADAAIVAAYGLLLPVAILEACPMGCINVHPSKLPRWRGAAPIQRTIMAGDKTTAMCIMQMAAGLDTGDILWQREVAIPKDMTAGELHDTMAGMAGPAVLETLEGLRAGSIMPQPQSTEGITYATKILKDEARIDFSRPAEKVLHHILALSPFPGAHFEYGGEKIKILKASLNNPLRGKSGCVLDSHLTLACGTGAIRPSLVQRPGKKPMSPEEMLRGFAIPAGTQLQS
jgi:methionyl-tRNA formyltransferase